VPHKYNRLVYVFKTVNYCRPSPNIRGNRPAPRKAEPSRDKRAAPARVVSAPSKGPARVDRAGRVQGGGGGGGGRSDRNKPSRVSVTLSRDYVC